MSWIDVPFHGSPPCVAARSFTAGAVGCHPWAVAAFSTDSAQTAWRIGDAAVDTTLEWLSSTWFYDILPTKNMFTIIFYQKNDEMIIFCHILPTKYGEEQIPMVSPQPWLRFTQLKIHEFMAPARPATERSKIVSEGFRGAEVDIHMHTQSRTCTCMHTTHLHIHNIF